jgi:hypothetical protein
MIQNLDEDLEKQLTIDCKKFCEDMSALDLNIRLR